MAWPQTQFRLQFTTWWITCLVGPCLSLLGATTPASAPAVIVAEGRVSFATVGATSLRLEIRSASGALWAEIAAPNVRNAEQYLGRTVRARGIRDGNRMHVAALADLQVIGPVGSDREAKLLTESSQVIQLSAEDSNRMHPVRLRGAATFIFNDKGLCLQDASGAVWVRCHPAAFVGGAPRPGDEIEVRGSTMADQFASRVMAAEIRVLGQGVFPEPIRPTWDSLLSRNLAHLWVEMDGVFGPVRNTTDRLQMSLSRAEGLVPVQFLSSTIEPAELTRLKSYENGVVRIRGCVVPNTSLSTSDVRGSLIYVPDLSWVSLVEEPPADLFALSATPVARLFRYDPRATAVQRSKVAGTVLYAEGDEGFLDDGTGGIRLLREGGVEASPGDRIEAVGFIDLGEGYPTLRLAAARKTGAGEVPAPIDVDLAAILKGTHAGRRVRMEALLVGVRDTAAGQSLDLQLARHLFEARLAERSERLSSLRNGSTLHLTGVLRCEGVSPSLGGKVQSFSLLLGSPADVTVTMLPPWWNARNAAIALGLLVGVLALSALWIALLRRQVRTRSEALAKESEARRQADEQQAIAKERTRIARDIHDDLGAGLTEIAMLADLGPDAAGGAGDTERTYVTIATRSRAALASLEEIVWAVNPGNDTLQRLADYLCAMAERCFENVDVKCWRHVPLDLPAAPVRAEVRHNLALAVKEAFANALRHTHATEVTLRATWEQPWFKVSVADNGSGFDTSKCDALGNGLRHQRERMAAIGGEVSVQSSPGNGTVVRFAVPLKNAGAASE